MSRRPLYIVAPVLLACALGGLAWRSNHADATPPQERAHAAEARSSTRARPPPVEGHANRARYQLVAEHVALVDDRAAASVNVAGEWTTTERRDGRTEVQLAATRLSAEGDTPPTIGDVSAVFVVVKRDGLLAEIAFPEAMSGRAKDLLAELATTFQLTERPGAAWTVEEEDLMGRYEATYTRAGDTLTRKRGRYTAMRGKSGIEASRGDVLVSVEESTFVLDAQGLASATVKLRQTSSLGKGMPSVTLVLSAKLVRVDAAQIALAAGPDLAPEAITTHIDRAAIARKRNESLVAGARAPELIEGARAAAHLDPSAPNGDHLRTNALRRLAALVRLDGGAAAEVADAVRAKPEDRAAVGLLVGALSSAPSADATAALTSLLSAPLPEETHSAVLTSLALAAMPTEESAAALTSALDGPHGDQAALALGAEVRKLADDVAGEDAVQQLVDRYTQATTPGEKRLYLLALANTGSREVLEIMLDAIQGPDFELSRVATYGLRLIPGDDVDDQLQSLILSGSSVMFQALQAVGYRSPALWEPRLAAAKAQFKDQKRVLEAIQALLTRWANLSTIPQP